MAQAEEFKFTLNLTLNTLRIDIVFIGLLMCQCCPLMETVSQWSHVFLPRWRTGLIDFLKIQIIQFFFKTARTKSFFSVATEDPILYVYS